MAWENRNQTVNGFEVDGELYLSRESRERGDNPFRGQISALYEISGMLSMAGGSPSSSVFPYEKITVKLKTGETLTIDDSTSTSPLSLSLQYPLGPGPLLPMIIEHMLTVHKPLRKQRKEWDCVLSTGSTDAIDKVIRMLMEPGDSVFAEEWSYPSFLQILRALNIRPLSVPMDHEGMIPSQLDDACLRLQAQGKKLPQVIYLIPHGQNPTGTSSSLQRKRDIYNIARKYNLLIIEDDAYYNLQYPLQIPNPDHPTVLDMPGLGNDPSFFSIDTDSRVIRMDSMSKLIAPMIRVGWITASVPFIQALQRHSSLSSLGPSAFSSGVLALELAGPRWEQRVRAVQLDYYLRRQSFLACMERHLHGLAEWGIPQAGMFIWVRFFGIKNTRLLMETGAKFGVLVLPGDMFSAEDAKRPSSFARLNFASIEPSLFGEALRRLAKAVKHLLSHHSARL